MGLRGPKPGRPYKSVEQHKLEGTFRKDRHAPKVDMSEPLLPKPKHLPPSKRTVSPQWIRCEADERAVDAGYWVDERFAKHFAKFAKQHLRLWEGDWAGKPFELLDWQYEDVIAPLFGWFRFDDEIKRPVRRFTRAYIEIPKKNGKSPLAAAVGAYMFTVDGEGGAKVFSAATSREQASIVHSHALNMIEASPDLAARCKINRTSKTIFYAPTKSFYRAIASEASGQEGLNGNCAIIDELHAWQGRGLWDALRYMTASRSQPIIFVITTAGDDIHSICREQHDYAAGVLSGAIDDPGFLPVIYAAGPTDDPGSPETWRRANPSLGSIIRESELREAYNEATRSASLMAAFKRYRLDIWNTSTNAWLKQENWEACQEDYNEADLYGERCGAGLDLSKTRDMTALVLVFPDSDRPDMYRQLAYFWLPEATVEANRHLLDFRPWVRDGWLRTIPGEVIDYGLVERDIIDILDKFDVSSLAYDRAFANELTQRLEEQHGVNRYEFPQTVMAFTGPTSEYERLVIAGKMRHNGNPILTWQASHVQVKTDPNNNKRPVKPRHHDIRKIDGIVAAIMALDAVQKAPATGRSFYADNEFECG